jgi:hypothetical protein
MKKLIQITLLLLSIFYIQSQAQVETTITEATTKEGKVVILKSDGTWTYKPETNSDTKTNQTDGTATVYFYRVKEITGLDNRNLVITINNKPAFKMPQYRFIGAKLKPGRYEIQMRKKKTGTMIEVEARKVYFVRVSQTAAGYFSNEDVSEINEKQAVFQMRELTILEDSKLEDSSLVWVKERPEYKK